MKLSIKKAVVLGSGVMGASIAGHLTAAGIKVTLLDMPYPTDENPRNFYAQSAVKKLTDPRSGLLFSKSLVKHITIGNFEDDLTAVKDADWVIEVIIEKLEPKVELFKKVSSLAPEGCILSSNTSGISINAIAEGVSPSLKKNFLGTHFFNPPRIMKLLEVIPAAETDHELVRGLSEFASKRLGKTVVVTKDTPNFIANRIGVENNALVLCGLEKFNISVAMADFLTGKLIARPSAGALGTCDLVGLDVMSAATKTNCQAQAAASDKSASECVPKLFYDLIEQGQFGNKAGKGFYTKDAQKNKLMWDYQQSKYVPKVLEVPSALKDVSKENSSAQIIKLIDSNTPEGDFLWYILKGIFLYSARCVPEITDDYRKIDLAMQLGYNWTQGPFQLWDTLGAKEIAERITAEGEQLPEWINSRLNDHGQFYDETGFWGLRPQLVSIKSSEGAVVFEADGVRLKNIGDGVGAIIIDTPNGSITNAAAVNLAKAVCAAENEFIAAVITSSGRNFCVGADLKELLKMIDSKDENGIIQMVRNVQNLTHSIKYASIPIVAAPFGSALGGGAEICLNAPRIVAHAEFKIGLVEANIGLLPAGGGLKELGMRAMTLAGKWKDLYVLPVLMQYSNLVSSSTICNAFEAKDQGLLRETDRIVLDRDRLLEEAKKEALSMAYAYQPKLEQTVPFYGRTGFAAISMGTYSKCRGGFITEHDAIIADKIALVLNGGNVPDNTPITEQRLLDLECDAFVELSMSDKTAERIRTLLSEGKPVRN